MPSKVNRVEVEDRFPEMIEATQDGLDAYIERVWEETVEQIIRNMRRGRNAMGRPWRPTEDPSDNTPLVDTGRMMVSVGTESFIAESARAGVFSAGPDYVDIHEFGAPDANIPKRSFLLPGLEYAVDITPRVFRDEVDGRIDRVLMD